MGIIITNRMLSSKNQIGLPKPVIYCNPSADLIEQAIPLNHTLAEALMQYKPARRTFQVERCFQTALTKLPDGAVIKDFNVLFNPEYKIDVLKILIRNCKAKPFRAIWPGTLQDGKLIYAEIGYKDYKEYDVDAYDVTCVQGG
ncbi:MAG: BREX-3 system P-loop-containing protein BrxF [Phascolarctobacterium sp.]|nr:BREX-3 system P-loop-containing protein BrxF [Phascolarctobacterium sp.]